ncbi:RNA helicase [Coemansia sp. RSA 1358]|nr:RNA helicase [Coemansia umbellata]KAJ2619039.1 RNA helicase [Coemansia sp. RSA 1358]
MELRRMLMKTAKRPEISAHRVAKLAELSPKVADEWPSDADINEGFAEMILNSQLDWFCSSQSVLRRCALFGITTSRFYEWSVKYAKMARSGKIPSLQPKNIVPILKRDGKGAFNGFLVNQFFAFLGKAAPYVVRNIDYLREITDLRHPQEWSLGARNMKRRIIMHVGPTNSGKTYHALERLKQPVRGVYCSPLRLLAYEVYNRMLSHGSSCMLITGEDRRMPDLNKLGLEPYGYTMQGDPISQTISCTIEMFPSNIEFHVAVIDEIQMITDTQRGWAWTNALLNLKASEIHLCGEPSAVPLVRKIFASMDEEVDVRHYTRLGPLEVTKDSLKGKWSNVQKGDCVVTFSRKDIYDTKKIIEARTGLKCAVIYGGLPPESRVEQARLFNDPSSGYDVLVASDAIGMGINLNIKRVVFKTLEKWDGEVIRPISVSQTRQIGGRAGRFKTGNDIGQVTSLWSTDLEPLKKLMDTQPPNLHAAGIKPPAEIIELFSYQFPNVPFHKLWRMFCDICTVDKNYFLCNFRDQEDIAKIIEELPLTIRDKYQFIYAPAQTNYAVETTCLKKYAEAVAYRRECNIHSVIRLPTMPPKSREDIRVLEQWHRSISLYQWLSYQFAYIFKMIDEAEELRNKCQGLIHKGLLEIDNSSKPPD